MENKQLSDIIKEILKQNDLPGIRSDYDLFSLKDVPKELAGEYDHIENAFIRRFANLRDAMEYFIKWITEITPEGREMAKEIFGKKVFIDMSNLLSDLRNIISDEY